MAEDANDESAKLLKINDLADLLSYHSNKYYNEASPEISDSEFDSLRDELESLDPNHPQPVSYTHLTLPTNREV